MDLARIVQGGLNLIFGKFNCTSMKQQMVLYDLKKQFYIMKTHLKSVYK